MDHRVILYNLPTKVKGMTVKTGEYYTIILNSKHCYEQNLKSYLHELKHIKNRDFEKLDADEIERDVRKE